MERERVAVTAAHAYGRAAEAAGWHGKLFNPIYPTIGGTDLFLGAGAGMYPPRGDSGSGEGMLGGPDHPLFGGPIGGQQRGFGYQGGPDHSLFGVRIGGQQRGYREGPDHPLFGGRICVQQSGFRGVQPRVPLGARFDPYGPPGVPSFEFNIFTWNQRCPGGGTHPDLEYFRDNDFI